MTKLHSLLHSTQKKKDGKKSLLFLITEQFNRTCKTKIPNKYKKNKRFFLEKKPKKKKVNWVLFNRLRRKVQLRQSVEYCLPYQLALLVGAWARVCVCECAMDDCISIPVYVCSCVCVCVCFGFVELSAAVIKGQVATSIGHGPRLV